MPVLIGHLSRFCPVWRRMRLALAATVRGDRVYRNTALQMTLRVNAYSFSAKTAIPPPAYTVRSTSQMAI